MSNDQATNHVPDSTLINVDDEQSVQQWADKFDSTPEQIRDAVAEVGDQAADVEMHLKGTHATTNADQEARAEEGDASV